MPGYKAIGQVGLGGFLYVAATKLISKLSHYGETGTPVPERPARYTPGALPTLSAWSSQETFPPIPNIPQNVTATITMSRLSPADPSTPSPLWAMFLSLWSTVQVIIHFLTEQCGELIAELTVQLLFVIAFAYLGNHIDQVLRRILGHPKFPTADECIDEEAPENSSSMRITKATVNVLHRLADKIQYRINNLEAIIANIIVEGKQAIHNLCTELGHAKRTITGLERKLRDMVDDRDRKLEEANTKLESSIQKVHDLEVELEEISTKYDDAVEDSQTKLEDADKKLNKSENDLSEAAEKIAALGTNLQCMVDDRDKAANDGHTEAEEAKKYIIKLEAQRNYWQGQFEESKATTTEKIDKAVATAKKNADKAKERLLEIAKVGTDSEISKLKTVHEKKEKDLIAAKNQSASEIVTLKEALAKMEEKEKDLIVAKDQSANEIAALKEALAKKEVEESASSFNPAAKEFTPYRQASSGSTLTSTPRTSLPATPFSPSPSPFSTTLYQHTSLPPTSFSSSRPPFPTVLASFATVPPPFPTAPASFPSVPSSFPITPSSFPIAPSPFPTAPAPFPTTPAPFPTTPYQHTPVKKQELRGEPKRNLDGLNEMMAERSRRTMMGMPAEDEETKPMSKEELGKCLGEFACRHGN